MTIAATRTTLANALAACGSKHVYDKEPDTIASFPCIIVGNPTGQYDDTFGGQLTYTFPVAVLASRAVDSSRAVVVLDPFIDPASSTSVRHALATVAAARVVGFTNYGGGYTLGEHDYAGVTFEVQVLA